MAPIEGTHSGIRSWFQNDEKISTTIKSHEKTIDPWSHHFQFYSHDKTKTKARKFALAFFSALISVGLIPTISVIHDFFVRDKPKVLDSFSPILENIQNDLERMDIRYVKSRALAPETMTLDQIRKEVHVGFKGDAMKTALFLRAIGQGPSVTLKEMMPTESALGRGDLLLYTGLTQDSAVFDLAAKTVTVTYHQKCKYMPTQSELRAPTETMKAGKHYTTTHTYDLGVDLGAWVMTATFDFKRDLATYSITPDTTENDKKALFVPYE